MATKKQILANLRAFSAEELAQAVQEGVVTTYELSKTGQYTPRVRRKVNEILDQQRRGIAPAAGPAAPSTTGPAPSQPITGPSPSRPISEPVTGPGYYGQQDGQYADTQPADSISRNPYDAINIMPDSRGSADNIPSLADETTPYNPNGGGMGYGGQGFGPQQGYGPSQGYDSVETRLPDREPASAPTAQGKMFGQPFSFKGRIRRREYGVAFIVLYVWTIVQFTMPYLVMNITETMPVLVIVGILLLLVTIPVHWQFYAQSTKRCHDLDHSGWFQLIPFYFFWLLFVDGKKEPNRFGPSPKM